MRGKVVAITGASRGIGSELARQLASCGARLVLAARTESELEEVAAACRERGAAVITVRADVAVERDCQAIVSGAVLGFGRLDVLVNNAGITMVAWLQELEDASILEQVMRVNYLGAAYCTYYALPYLRESRGQVVAINSLAGLLGVPTRTGYAASKHAMTGFFDSLRIELEGSGVTVTSIHPGFVATAIRASAGADTVREAMSVEACAARIVRAIERRERRVVMTARGRMGLWLRLLAPGLVDRIARRAIERGR
ncbi:MAG TPA: SDR family oxidoreductase [Usitatibacter sp.]|nr:SDR family oxidoreductase [Usitatibacter sp.]